LHLGDLSRPYNPHYQGNRGLENVESINVVCGAAMRLCPSSTLIYPDDRLEDEVQKLVEAKQRGTQTCHDT
jgi:hypothetical protein